MYEFLNVDEKNILQKAKNLVEKTKAKIEKPKDVPRYKTTVQYEKQFKQEYAGGLMATCAHILTLHNKLINATPLPNTGTSTSI